ncbi:MAG: hypothetical protein UU37_C0003G0028 [Candidatus Gottesmanbacteria bacterium GW2011_GWA2_41_12]|uniref:Uncharacterized protein n=2 Tax=Candidatus Gottesmaniibacteriota TaxID=1752720 RepID=A0A0G0UHZ0_9BACT|nr:MAG: hypothetical protein UT63_C0025G0026 [Candidatus Gottesmanbacteria bacterium GW2011_GWC2_39_8]KKR88454.1 MAG: hypothetical protein UU37_C0003G0028 [Candidatus Gottesmanbacteria bacterium GW2011_GWA2_41_12]
MQKIILIFLLLVAVLAFIYFYLKPFPQKTAVTSPTKETSSIVDQAKKLYQQKKNESLDFTKGPCLSQEIAADWAFDIAHNPRQEVDNLPENQCQSYMEGKTHHFVELDIDGNFIRAL